MDKYQWKEVPFNTVLSLKNEWLDTLSAPQDGMWEAFRDGGTIKVLSNKNDPVGYASVGEGNHLLQFYLKPELRQNGLSIFHDFLKSYDVTNALVGTNNPVFLSLALDKMQSATLHTYLFRSHTETAIPGKIETPVMCNTEDLDDIVEFCAYGTGAPVEWLTQYIGSLIQQGEVFVLKQGKNIIGTCEVRKSKSAPSFADIGMIVSPDFRKKGYGTYLLNQAKSIALSWGKTPICSCEKANPGSFRSIQNCGFISDYQLLNITF